MLSPFTSTLDTLLALQNAVDQTMQSGLFRENIRSRGLFPPVNIFEQEGNLMIVAELSGMNKDDLKIEIQNKQLRIRGKREIGYDKGASVHRAERQPGTFDRTIKLPYQVETDKVTADYQNGLLALHMPRAEADRPRQISIN